MRVQPNDPNAEQIPSPAAPQQGQLDAHTVSCGDSLRRILPIAAIVTGITSALFGMGVCLGLLVSATAFPVSMTWVLLVGCLPTVAGTVCIVVGTIFFPSQSEEEQAKKQATQRPLSISVNTATPEPSIATPVLTSSYHQSQTLGAPPRKLGAQVSSRVGMMVLKNAPKKPRNGGKGDKPEQRPSISKYRSLTPKQKHSLRAALNPVPVPSNPANSQGISGTHAPA